MKRVLITGANGLLGQKLVTTFVEDFEVIATAREEQSVFRSPQFIYEPLDITNYQQVGQVLETYRPEVVINAAAYTNVDGCEEEREVCWRANVKAVENLAVWSRRIDAQLVHVSTDYIFDGYNGPYDEEARPNPLCYYGKAKLASENAVKKEGIPYIIARTSVVYGVGKGVKPNFFLWVYRSLKQGKAIRVVTDQYNTPTLADDLAEGILLALRAGYEGVVNISGSEFMNRYQMAVEIAQYFGFPTERITPITTDQLNQKAVRPLKAGLKIDRAIQIFQFQPKTLKSAMELMQPYLQEDAT